MTAYHIAHNINNSQSIVTTLIQTFTASLIPNTIRYGLHATAGRQHPPSTLTSPRRVRPPKTEPRPQRCRAARSRHLNSKKGRRRSISRWSTTAQRTADGITFQDHRRSSRHSPSNYRQPTGRLGATASGSISWRCHLRDMHLHLLLRRKPVVKGLGKYVHPKDARRPAQARCHTRHVGGHSHGGMGAPRLPRLGKHRGGLVGERRGLQQTTFRKFRGQQETARRGGRDGRGTRAATENRHVGGCSNCIRPVRRNVMRLGAHFWRKKVNLCHASEYNWLDENNF